MFLFQGAFLLKVLDSLSHPALPSAREGSRIQHDGWPRPWCPVCKENHLPMKGWDNQVSTRVHMNHAGSFPEEGYTTLIVEKSIFIADFISSCSFPIIRAPNVLP